MYPRLAEISELEFNVRLLILTRFNVILSNTLPYLDFIGVESPHKRGTLAANLSRMRSIIFSEMKIKFFKARLLQTLAKNYHNLHSFFNHCAGILQGNGQPVRRHEC